MKIMGAQIRAARAFLRWTIADLAKAADVGLSTIQKVEEVDGEPRVVSTLQWRSDARDEA
jgi:transcriptional regulator with XRE-family HTH domain